MAYWAPGMYDQLVSGIEWYPQQVLVSTFSRVASHVLQWAIHLRSHT
jgi:hypothetical protein